MSQADQVLGRPCCSEPSRKHSATRDVWRKAGSSLCAEGTGALVIFNAIVIAVVCTRCRMCGDCVRQFICHSKHERPHADRTRIVPIRAICEWVRQIGCTVHGGHRPGSRTADLQCVEPRSLAYASSELHSSPINPGGLLLGWMGQQWWWPALREG